MPDPITPTPVAAPTGNPQPAPTPQPQPSAEPVPQPSAPAQAPLSTREQLYQQYYASLPGNAPASAQPAQPTATPAQGVQPEPVAPPVASPALTPSDIASLVEEKIQSALQQALSAQQPVAAAPSNPPPSTPPANWLDLIAQGKTDEGTQLLVNQAVEAARTESVTQALELFRVEQEITNFISDLRGKNPDLAPLEDMIGYKAQRQLEADKAAGKIRSNADFVTRYKAALDAAVNDAKTVVQQLRGAGRDAAMVTRSEVLSASTIPPTAIPQDRGQPAAAPAAPQPETPQQYLARRLAESRRKMGLGQ